MNLFGLIGYPLGHSFSKRYFTEKFEREGIADCFYDLFPLTNIAELPALLEDKKPNLRGLNVTIPYKEAVIPFVHNLDVTAKAVGAVNCIKISPDGQLTGYNTDVIGFRQSLIALEAGRWAKSGTTALILGTGGAAKASAYIFRQLGISVQFVSRQPQLGEDEVIRYEDVPAIVPKVSVIVNTTPLGMAPNEDTCPDLPFNLLNAQHLVFDLVYNPTETLLLRAAKASGCSVQNGLDMLYLQAEAGWQIWNISK